MLLFAKLNEKGEVINPLSQGFFLASVVLDPETLALLNPSPARSQSESHTMFLEKGHHAYAETQTVSYLRMLEDALEESARRKRLAEKNI